MRDVRMAIVSLALTDASTKARKWETRRERNRQFRLGGFPLPCNSIFLVHADPVSSDA